MYAVVLGGKYSELKKRFMLLQRLWEQGTRYSQIVVLCGEQPIHQTEKEALILDGYAEQQMPSRECDLSRFCHQHFLKTEVQQLPIVFSDTPQKTIGEGKVVQPNTADTVRSWRAKDPFTKGACLIISSQPFVQQQDAIIRSLLPRAVDIETIGTAIDETIPTAVVLDTLARTIYQISLNHKEFSTHFIK